MFRILLAEDNLVNRQIIQAMVTKGGYEVHSVENGLEALEAVQQEEFTCVLMDIHMPEMDGIEATRRIRSLGTDKANIPIIAVTASVVVGIREDAFDAGINEFVTKPVNGALLCETIERFTSAH